MCTEYIKDKNSNILTLKDRKAAIEKVDSDRKASLIVRNTASICVSPTHTEMYT